jgi:hypothetical protein
MDDILHIVIRENDSLIRKFFFFDYNQIFFMTKQPTPNKNYQIQCDM